jgi:hypothetical protein
MDLIICFLRQQHNRQIIRRDVFRQSITKNLICRPTRQRGPARASRPPALSINDGNTTAASASLAVIGDASSTTAGIAQSRRAPRARRPARSPPRPRALPSAIRIRGLAARTPRAVGANVCARAETTTRTRLPACAVPRTPLATRQPAVVTTRGLAAPFRGSCAVCSLARARQVPYGCSLSPARPRAIPTSCPSRDLVPSLHTFVPPPRALRMYPHSL